MGPIPVAMISIIMGIILLMFNVIPIFGWAMIILAFAMGMIQMILSSAKTGKKYTAAVLIIVFVVLVGIVIILSYSTITLASKQTMVDIHSIFRR